MSPYWTRFSDRVPFHRNNLSKETAYMTVFLIIFTSEHYAAWSFLCGLVSVSDVSWKLQADPEAKEKRNTLTHIHLAESTEEQRIRPVKGTTVTSMFLSVFYPCLHEKSWLKSDWEATSIDTHSASLLHRLASGLALCCQCVIPLL